MSREERERMTFSRGDQILVTYDRAHPARTELVLPVTVVDDSPSSSMFYLAAGTPTRALFLADGSTIPRDTPYSELASMARVLGDAVWEHTNVLICWQPGWTWDVRLMWDSTSGEFLCWYVNIQDQIRRSETGFTTTDHFLDIVVTPDKTWTLKDGDEFEDAVNLGMYSKTEEACIRKSLASAIQHVEAQAWPFDANLVGFTADPDWRIPGLPR